MSKKPSGFLWAGLALIAFFSSAQAQVRSEIAMDRAQIQSDRQAIMAENLPLTEAEAKAFWPLYREYRGELQKLGDRMEDLVLGYAKSFDVLSDAQATFMLDDALAIERAQAKLKSEWVARFRKVLPTKTVTRMYQIDNKLDSILRYEAAEHVPLVESAKQ
jgi:hypothetical protein